MKEEYPHLIIDPQLAFSWKPKSKLIINRNLQIDFIEPMPNKWYRFWQKLMFGFEWEKIE